ncbi:hypothetical protein [Pedobacter sp. R20-19]|uniref:hypothetical protein n=1 Tax=Pedobacter sp. R20-19 TaxID=1270196 RepID=UPI0004937C40|nr:hypothetical protein [Pedobacter sp. R20-19]
MGSTGSGSFSDYSKRKPTQPQDNNGGASGVDKCGKGFSANLEEVSRCFYFINYGVVPASGGGVKVAFNGSRLVVETALGEEIGYLPTKYNYLRTCLDDGFQYAGSISSSKNTPTPSVLVDIVPL